MNSLLKTARLAGAGYIIIFISGIFANFLVLENIVVPGDANATVVNIESNAFLFRIGILSFIIMVIADLIVAWALYLIFKPVNKNISLLAAWLRLVNATIFGVALVNIFNVLHIVKGASYFSAIDSNLLHAQIMLFFEAFNNTWLLGLIFFGFHLFVLSYLIIKSNYLPKLIGLILTLAAFGYLIDSFAQFLLPNYADYKDIFMLIVIVPGVIGELSLALWLLIKGVNQGENVAKSD